MYIIKALMGPRSQGWVRTNLIRARLSEMCGDERAGCGFALLGQVGVGGTRCVSARHWCFRLQGCYWLLNQGARETKDTWGLTSWCQLHQASDYGLKT